MKKSLSLILVLGLMLSLLTPFVSGAAIMPLTEDAAVSNYDEPTPEMMEEMIKRVRPMIEVPEEYEEFSWDFRSGYGYSSPSWYFTWYGDKGEISVECDTDGRIFSYQTYDYNKERKTVLPEVSPEKLMPLALEFLEKTAPHLSKLDLRLESTSTGSIFYNHTYTYYFIRYENNIPVPENAVSISINYITEKVDSFSSNIVLGLDFEADVEIDENKAKELLGGTQKMDLSYRLKTEYDEDGNLVERLAYLVYTPALSYVSVDAQSGKVYTERTKWEALKAPTYGTNGGILMDSVAKGESADAEEGYRLSEKELEQLAVLESLITKDEASKVIFGDKDLYIPENAYLSDARLSKRSYGVKPLGENGEKQEKYTWNLYFLTPGETGLGINAVVDAHDGTLLTYGADLPYAYHYEQYGLELPELKFDDAKAEKIAADFIKKHQPEKFKNVVRSSSYGFAPMKYVENSDGTSTPVYRASRLSFVRQNEGIDFTYNYFNIGVDYATGKITSYSYTWYDDVIFESPKDAVGEKKALASLYAQDGFGLNYEINKNYTYVEGVLNSVNYETYTRAVYSLYSPVTTTIRAIDGTICNYNGEAIAEDKFTGVYTDIENHWAKETIRKFAWIGYGPEGDKFFPNDSISGKDFVSLLETVRIYGDSSETATSENLTRMTAVKLIIDYLGYGKIAKLENVFITDFADNADFTPDDIGYAAIARGFGLIEGDGENFRPYDTLTRAEALTIAENTIVLGLID